MSAFRARGTVWSAGDGMALADAAVGGAAILNGEAIDTVASLNADGVPTFPPSNENGEFEIAFEGNELGPCKLIPPFPTPDTIELVVLSGGCEQRFAINIEEDMLIRVDGVIAGVEFPDPIVVPPCEDQ